MGNLIVTVNNPEDLQLLNALLRRLGLESQLLSESERRLLSRRRLAEGVAQIPSGDPIPEEEIQAEVESVRQARYTKKNGGY